MERQILGVIAASAAAPYLVGLFFFIYAALSELVSAGSIAFGEFLVTSLFILVFGTYGLVLFGLPVLIGAIIAAFILHSLNVKSLIWTIGIGGLTGLCCGLYINLAHLERDWITLPDFLLSGSICGWIYWRIAIRDRAEDVNAKSRQEAC